MHLTSYRLCYGCVQLSAKCTFILIRRSKKYDQATCQIKIPESSGSASKQQQTLKF